MAYEKSHQPHLIVPAKILLRVAGELNVVGRIGIDEVVLLEFNRIEVAALEVPSRERRHVFREVGYVIDLPVTAKRHVEFTTAIEPAQSVVAGAIQIVEKRG